MTTISKATATFSSYPFITQDTFKCQAHLIYRENFNHKLVVRPNMIIYSKGDFLILSDWFREEHQNILYNYIFMTGDSTNPVDERFLIYLNDKKIIKWFAKNLGIKHKNLIGLPIGVPNREHIGKLEIIHKYFITDYQKLLAEYFSNRPKKCLYYNFLSQNRANRMEVDKCLKENGFSKSPFVGYENYLEDMKQYRFVASPLGAGYDCYRHWEALLSGCIPIIEHSPIDDLLQELPVIFIKSGEWKNVTEKFLFEEYEKLKQCKFNIDRLFMPYYINKIQCAMTEILDFDFVRAGHYFLESKNDRDTKNVEQRLLERYWDKSGNLTIDEHYNEIKRICQNVNPKYAVDIGFTNGQSATAILLNSRQLIKFISFGFIQTQNGTQISRKLEEYFSHYKCIWNCSTEQEFINNLPEKIDLLFLNSENIELDQNINSRLLNGAIVIILNCKNKLDIIRLQK